jgi:hypothetical protein
MNLARMEAIAVDLHRHQPGSLAAETAGVSFDQARHHWNDPELKAAADIAYRYEDDTGQKVKAYAAGWPNLVNWETCGAAASNTTFTTLQQIGVTQQPNIFPSPGMNAPGLVWHMVAFGIVGSAAGTATTTFGIDLNGTATAVAISASQTPPTSTVQTWQYTSMSTLISVGASGTIQTSGNVTGVNATPATNVIIPATQAAAATFNTTVANYFNLVASWSVSAAGNLYGVNGFAVVQYN